MTEEEKDYLLRLVEDLGSVEKMVQYTPIDKFYYLCRVPYMKGTPKDGSGFDFFIEIFEQKEYYEYCKVLLDAKNEFLSGEIVWNTEDLSYYEKFLK